jgi:hypothetical protein
VIDIEGWHFRNSSNTGPNTGEVNAPGERRTFIFSPRLNRCKKITIIAHDGRGVLDISDMDLSKMEEGKKASILKNALFCSPGRRAIRLPDMSTEDENGLSVLRSFS